MAGVVVLALVHMRLMMVLDGLIRQARGTVPRRYVRAIFAGAHVDAGLVAGFAMFHRAAEATCGSKAAGMDLRLALPLLAAGAMLLMAWRLLWPHLRSTESPPPGP